MQDPPLKARKDMVGKNEGTRRESGVEVIYTYVPEEKTLMQREDNCLERKETNGNE